MENSALNASVSTEKVTFIDTTALLEHWQGHRRVTRRVIEAFPEEQLFNYSIGGMRPFGQLVMEMVGMTSPGIKGVATGKWNAFMDAEKPATKAEILELWDRVTEELNADWTQVPPHRFRDVDVAFGQYEGPNYQTILYFIDNEIHHRGQGYVYLRSLGIEPPPFWDRN
jgi:uncharacterized damage-inducible protein DinB